MTTAEYFLRMFAYDYWANKVTLRSIEDLTAGQERPHTLLAHIVGMQKLWHHRLTGEETDGLTVWPVIHDSEFKRELEERQGAWWELLRDISSEDLNETVDYATTEGQGYNTTVADILSHVLLDAAYHRSQIASAVKEAGGTSGVTDFIAYVRAGASVTEDEE